VQELELLHQEIRRCRRCEIDGFPVVPPPLVWGQAPAPFLLIGQAPSLSDLRGGRMYLGPAAQKLCGWLYEAGFSETDIGTTIFMTALTLCFPGRLPGKSTDRAPSPKERANCRPWLDAHWEFVQPRVVILFGKMAIDTFLPRMTLEDAVGQTFERDGRIYIPLPHSSGASTWLNDAGHRALLAEAILRIREAREQTLQLFPSARVTHNEGQLGP
jgi:uracil-DNA glycosylase family 4